MYNDLLFEQFSDFFGGRPSILVEKWTIKLEQFSVERGRGRGVKSIMCKRIVTKCKTVLINVNNHIFLLSGEDKIIFELH